MTKNPRKSPAIEVEGLEKIFRGGFYLKRIVALADASFTVPRGCIFGLVGPNGAGKTTTIKILTSLIRATSGRAHIDGFPVPSIASRRNVGYLPENPHFYDHLRPLEYLRLVGDLYGMGRRQRASKANELLEFVGLAEAAQKPIRKFSKGMTQRLGIAQTLIHDPEIVILDEPQSGLDPIGRKEVKDMIRGLKARGCTVFFASHILHDVEDICDVVALMIRGTVREVGSVDKLLNPKVLETEVEVSNLDDAYAETLKAAALRWTAQSGSLLLTFRGSLDCDELLGKVVEAGGKILRVVPHRERLEDLFVREAGAKGIPKATRDGL